MPPHLPVSLYSHWFVPLRQVGGGVVGTRQPPESPWKVAACGDHSTGLRFVREPRSFTGSISTCSILFYDRGTRTSC